MAITYQFNKTSLQGLEKDLKMRQRTLPTLQSKETALRLEVKKAKKELADLDEEVNRRIKDYDQMLALWGEFDTSLIHVDDVRMSIKKIANQSDCGCGYPARVCAPQSGSVGICAKENYAESQPL